MKQDINSVENLMKILVDTNLTEISFESDDFKVMVKRPKLVPEAPSFKDAAEEAVAQDTPDYKEVKSYHIGRFSYHDKEGQPIIKVGDKVKDGQNIGNISTIGGNTPVKSLYDGVVKEILIENNSVVDYGKALILIEAE